MKRWTDPYEETDKEMRSVVPGSFQDIAMKKYVVPFCNRAVGKANYARPLQYYRYL